MKLSTLPNNTPDGQLVVVANDARSCVRATPLVATLQEALERWAEVAPGLQRLQRELDAGACAQAQLFEPQLACAPLPRAWQWLDGSAFQSHSDLMATVFGHDKPAFHERPLMYQGLSHQFLAAGQDVSMPSEEDGIDFEGEFGVITDTVPMGTSTHDALKHIRLIVLINDWSLRHIAPIEMRTGFGWIQAKPACSMGPIAVTPDELGLAWADGRVGMRLEAAWNGQHFGAPHGSAMAFGFHQLVAHAAYSRDLVAGTVIGSGTVSNEGYRQVGSACIAERRAIEMLDQGSPITPYMRFRDRVQLHARFDDGREGPFGSIDQLVVQHRAQPNA